MSGEYPLVEPTGSLLLAWQVSRESILLVGAGPVASSRLYHLVCAQPRKIYVVAPDDDNVDPEMRYRMTADPDAGAGGNGGVEIEWIKRKYSEHDHADLQLVLQDGQGGGGGGLGMVLVATDDATLSTRICAECRRLRIPVNVADVPPECDFYFGSVLRRGALSVMVSTNGKGPRIAARLRRRIEKSIPDGAGEAIARVGDLRAALRRVEPGKGTDAIAQRMQWMIRVSDQWSIEQLARMDPDMRHRVLQGWATDSAPSYYDVAPARINSLAALGVRAGRAVGLLGPGGSCPVDRDPDGNVRRCPFVLGMTGFVTGLVTASVAVAAWHRYSSMSRR